MADRVCVVHRGRGLQAAPAAELHSRPATAEVARLLDLPNLFQGTVVAHDRAAQNHKAPLGCSGAGSGVRPLLRARCQGGLDRARCRGLYFTGGVRRSVRPRTPFEGVLPRC